MIKTVRLSRLSQLASVLFIVGLSGCGAVDRATEAIIPDFSDEQLGNPMAGFVPAGGGQVMNNPNAGLSFNANSQVSTPIVTAAPAPTASAGLMAQASTGGVSAADAALLDAALDLAPSQMSGSASTGLVGSALNAADMALMGATAGSTTVMPQAPIVSSLTQGGPSAGFEVLTSDQVNAMMADGSLLNYTNKEQAAFQTPYFDGRANAVTGLRPTAGYTPVGTSPAVLTATPNAGPNSFSGETNTGLSAVVARTNQAAIPIYGGSQPLIEGRSDGTVRPGFVQLRSGSIQATLSFPPALAVANMYDANVAPITLTLTNVSSAPVTFQPDNILNQFPPYEIFRWTGAQWASITLDVAYNRDIQGISAPVTLAPGQSQTRSDSFTKVALLPMKVALPSTTQLAIRLRIPAQSAEFGRIDSGYVPIQVTDRGAFPTARSLTATGDAGFVVIDGARAVPLLQMQ